MPSYGFHPDAQAEYEEAIGYLIEHASPIIAAAFVDEVETAIKPRARAVLDLDAAVVWWDGYVWVEISATPAICGVTPYRPVESGSEADLRPCAGTGSCSSSVCKSVRRQNRPIGISAPH